jgi:hypothetical protein
MTTTTTTTARFFHFAMTLEHFKGPQSGDHCLLVLEQLVFAEPARVDAVHAPQAGWGAGNGAAFVLGQTHSVHGIDQFEGFVELRHPLSGDEFQRALLRCIGSDHVRAALQKLIVTAYTDAEEVDTAATGLRRALRGQYMGERYFMHGALCPAVARALRARLTAPDGRTIVCGHCERGLLVRTLLRALALADASVVEC